MHYEIDYGAANNISCTCVTRKQTLRSLSNVVIPNEGWAHVNSEFGSADIIDYILEKSVSCQKKEGAAMHPSFFKYDNNKDCFSLFSRDARHMETYFLSFCKASFCFFIS